jgi:cellulose synthase/poly-beta-1,6-N-acetylglucosamine synthase-like glycosyltransferase
LPHVTIQMPVYKEGLSSVIAPTIASLKKAISTYELQGGSANILVHDDGLQILSEDDRQQRIDFYADHGIGWTARPKHGENGFIRKGKFKKASNMNYGLALSNSVEEKLNSILRPSDWTQVNEVVAYERCLNEVLTANPEAWADGNIRIGDYILIIDSDTRVPEDCLLDAASEMHQTPAVAIIQFSSGVMQVSHNFFENGITFFTNLIYTSIRFGVSSGDVAAFVGHNAILRWSALQEVSFIDEEGKERFWAETCVSEDFDMALRLQMSGYTVRMAAWAEDGFKEGVSLTVYDELTRWQKYAYGCNELVFNPIRTWLWRSPFTPLFRRFICSSMPLASKINILAYIGTYYAIGSSWITTVVNYFAVGLFNGFLDKWYMDSWKLWISISIVFSLGSMFGLAIQRHRTGEMSFLPSICENAKWLLMMYVFFGGISIHISQALLCQMFEINMSWGATSKEVEFSNFFLEVPKVWSRFKFTFCFFLLIISGIMVMAYGTFIPWSYNITELFAIFPLVLMAACHLLLPIALNPEMMTFSW